MRGLFAAFAQQKPLNRYGLARTAETRYGVVLSLVERPDELLRAALLWSRRSVGEVLAAFPQLMLERLQELEVSAHGQQEWSDSVGKQWNEVAARASDASGAQRH